MTGSSGTHMITLPITSKLIQDLAIYPMYHISEEHFSKEDIVVRATDTEVFIMLLYHAHNLDVYIWMDLFIPTTTQDLM